MYIWIIDGWSVSDLAVRLGEFVKFIITRTHTHPFYCTVKFRLRHCATALLSSSSGSSNVSDVHSAQATSYTATRVQGPGSPVPSSRIVE